MINPKTKLTVLQDDNASFSDHTDNASDYLRDTFTVEMVAAEDYLYVGFYKPFNSIYFELDTPNTNPTTMGAEIYNGTAWVAHDMSDETKGLIRSGYMLFDKEDMKAATIDGTEKFYIRFRPDVDSTAIIINGINTVFADDQMLKQEMYEIDNVALLPAGATSHIAKHVASRNHIIQQLRNDGYIKSDDNTNLENITQFDLMDVFEVRQAATYLALSKIYLELSDDPEDTHWSKYQKYQDLYERAFQLARLTFDSDDDGLTDSAEKAATRKSVRWSR